MTRLSIRAKIILITISILIITFATNALVNGITFAERYRRVLESESFFVAQSLKLQLDRLFNLGLDLEGIVGFEQQCQDVVADYEDVDYAMVIDQDGRILFHSDPTRQGQLVTNQAVLTALMSSNPVAQEIMLDGVGYLDTLLPLFDNNARPIGAIRIGVPTSRVSQQTSQLLIWFTGVALISLVIASALLVVTVTTLVAEPLQKLVKVIQQIRAGSDLSARVTVTSGDEFGQLSAAFNEMLSSLQQSQFRIEQYAQDLEQKTGSLETANARLQADIEARIKIEQALAEARDQALEASRLKTELLAKVSHELRTPLGAILGYTELLKEGLYGRLSDQQEEVSAEIIKSTHYLTGLVNELLDQAQLETGRLRLQLEPFPVREMVSQVESKMKVLAHAKGLSLQTNVAADVPDMIIGDSNRLKQILVNLISNAIKFSHNGAVDVTIYCPEPARWAMQVVDTGIGMPDDAQDYIFDPFRQVDGSLTRKYTGAGLGLSIVKQLTLLMGGQITFKSQIGQGTTFTVQFPLPLIEKKSI
jgi:two-component system sensor histidine kinase BarA